MRRLAFALALLWAIPAGATVTVNVANAPGWQSSHSYALKDRVVAGAGWNGTAYTSGACLAVFAVTVGGTGGSDPTVFNTACASGTPAGVGGGLDGSVPAGWGSASTVTDGGVTWALLAVVDYVTITGFGCDDARNWATSTTYQFIDSVVNGGHCYTNRADPGVSASSGPGPTGTTFNSAITDGSASWYYQGEVTYTSTTHRVGHQISLISGSRFQMQYGDNVVVNLIYGGAQRQSYKPGANGEMTPMQLHYHNDLINDAEVRCLADVSLDSFDCGGAGTGLTYTVTYQCFSGDCWYQNVAAATTPLWYDVTKGSNIFNDAAQGASGAGDALNLGDSDTKISGLQLISMHAMALSTTPATYFLGPTNTNIVWVDKSIIVGGDNGDGAFSCDIACNLSNSFVASRSTVAQSFAVHLKYQGIVYNSTIACAPGVTNSTGISIFSEQATPNAVPWKNNTVIGCTNPYAHYLTITTSVDGADNATDVASAPTNTFTDLLFGTTYTAAALPGTTLSGITVANQFANPVLTAGADWRIKSPLASIYGAGAAFTFTPANWFAWMGDSTAASPDIYGTSRPFAGRYDLGAAELTTVTSNVHNAPGWLHSHTYTFASGPATRVLNGAGWNEGAGTYNPGSALNAYELTSGGSCTSAASGGPSGTGSSISDGTCTWKYLSGVDYISITGWAFDNQAWAAGAITWHTRVVSDAPLRSYVLTGANCTSSIAPTGTSPGTLGDGCTWDYAADILYTSGVSYIPTLTYTGPSDTSPTYNLTQNYTANLWNDREYLADANGEVFPITTGNQHAGRDLGPGEVVITCNPCYYLTVTAAPGESFRDSLTSSDALTLYGTSRGVTIHSSKPENIFNDYGFTIGDSYTNLVNLQIKSDNGAAVVGVDACNEVVSNSILEGSGPYNPIVILNCGPSVLSNSVIISHGIIGFFSKYPPFILHSTIVNPDSVTGSVGIVSNWPGPTTDPAVYVISNTAVFGFAHASASVDAGAPYDILTGDHNITDNSATDSGSAVFHFLGQNYVIKPLPGAVAYSVSESASFVAPGTDWRLSSGSSLRGAGSAYGDFVVNYLIQNAVPRTLNTDTPDIIGTTRPQSSAYDLGAWEFSGGAPAPVKGGKTRGGLWH